MRFPSRVWPMCLAGAIGLLALSPTALAATPEGAGGLALSESPLTIPGSPTESEQAVAEEQAKLTSPEAVVGREASASSYESLSASQAAEEDRAAFASLIEEPNGGPPRLPEGERISGFAGAYAARVDLGSASGETGLVQSTVPIAIEGSPGVWSPIDLGLREAGGGFEGVDPLVATRVPKSLGEGALLSGLGVTVTPVDGGGAPLGSVGTIDGSSVLFANSQTDTDTIVKLSTFGVSVDASLRSARSPEELSYELGGLPAGASLVVAADGSGAVSVVREGATVLSVPPPRAYDAAGRAVPVRSVSLVM